MESSFNYSFDVTAAVGSLVLLVSDLRPNQRGLYFRGDKASNGGDS